MDTAVDRNAGASGRPTPQPPPRVSVIIPHLNTPELLVRAIASVAAQKIDGGRFEIIVVDNGSRIALDALKAAWPDVRFLVQHEPGPGPARNLGIAHARADILAFIDADMQAEAGWLQAGLDALAAHAVGPVGGDVRIDTGGRSRLSGVEAFECEFAYRQEHYIRRERFSGAGNLIITRAMFDAAGPFGGIATSEDKLFGQRADALGMPTRFAPAMRALHPARTDVEDLAIKWQRLSVQKYSSHIAAGRSLLHWRLLALATLASAVAHMPRMLFSNRLSGFGNRLRGMGTLWRIRLARGLDMWRLSREAPGDAAQSAMNWNR